MSSPNPMPNQVDRTLYLEEILVQADTDAEFRVKLRVDGNDITMRHEEQTATWAPLHSLELTETSKIAVILKSGHTVAGISFRKQETQVDINNQAMETFWKSKNLVSSTIFDNKPATITLQLRPSTSLKTTRERVDQVKEEMKKYKTLMESSTEQNIGTFIKYGVVLAELNPMSKMAFGLVKVTFDLLKEQNKYDEMVSDLADIMERILPFAEFVLEDPLCDERELLEPLVKKLYELVVEAAKFICSYVEHSPTNRLFKSLEDRKMIKDLQDSFRKLKEDIDRAVSGATSRAASSIEKDLLLKRLRPIDEATYQTDRGCMDGTRTKVINDIVAWAVKPLAHTVAPLNTNIDKMLWVYGIPGIGKTALASSVCRQLHLSKNLGGSFFCRRDDPILAEPKRVLPTLIYRLAGMFSPYRNCVAQALREDPHLTPDSSSGELLMGPLRSLQKHPSRPLVLLIDAMDECGEPRSQRKLLDLLFQACNLVKWLRVIITSRPEHHIKSFFEYNRIVGQNLDMVDETSADIRLFTMNRMSLVASRCYLASDWPGEDRREQLIERSGGLFIFIETVSRVVDVPDPEIPLARILSGEFERANTELYKLYSTAITSQIGSWTESFQSIARVIVAVATSRPLKDETIASLMGLEERVVKTWVDKLGSILYRDDSQNGAIRVRHLSILDFLVGDTCPQMLRVDTRQANAELSYYCLRTMKKELRFNICRLETSYLPNSKIEGLDVRIQTNISDALQYSSLYWSNHLTLDVEVMSQEARELIHSFFNGEQPLYWLEVLSLMGRIPAGILSLQKIKERIKWFEDKTQSLIDDTLRFALAFTTPISTSAPHIYISALPFIPLESILWHNVSGSFSKLLRVCKGRLETWPARPHIWKGHSSTISSINYSHNGQYVVSGSFDRTIRIWDASTGAPVGEPLVGHTDIVVGVKYSPDDQKIISGSCDNTIRIWDASTGVPVGEPLTGYNKGVTSIACSPDGQRIASGSKDDAIRIWDASTGMPVGEPLVGHTEWISSVAYSPDGQRIVSGSWDYQIRVWDASTGVQVSGPWLQHGKSRVSCVIYSPDSQRVVSGSYDGTLQILDASTGASIFKPLGHTSRVNSVAYSPDGQNIISGSSDRTVRIWDATTSARVGKPMTGHTDTVASVAYSPDGQRIVSGSSDKTIRMWDASTGVLVGQQSTGLTSVVTSVAYSPDGQNIVSGSDDGTIQIWDATTGAPVGKPLTRRHDGIMSVSYSPDGQRIVSSSYDCTIRVWDVSTGLPIGKPLTGHTSVVTGVAYSPDGLYIVSSSCDHTIRIWDASTGVPVGEPLAEHTRVVTAISYSPDGRNIVSGSYDDTIRIWDASTGVPVGEPLIGHTNAVSAVAYFSDGQNIISGSWDHKIRIWDVSTAMPVGEPLIGHTDTVATVACSPDGQRIVSGSHDHTIRIWDVSTGILVGEPLVGHTDAVRCVAYSPDGLNIISGSHDHTIRMWDAITGAMMDNPLAGYIPVVTGVAYSPHARDITSASNHETISTSSMYDDGGSFSPQTSLATTRSVFHDVHITSSHPMDSDGHVFKDGATSYLSNDSTSYVSIAKEQIDPNGWVHCPEGLLFWVPEDFRNGLTSPSILTIPTTGRERYVRLEFSRFKYGTSWTEVYSGNE